ncbi:MAG: ring-cleaving dioxygenase [Chthoniobacterales bacterium]
MNITGLHHVTAIASDPQRNLDFHSGVLGLRLVKRTINFDDPGSYHFYFGDNSGTPGSILTFFPWPNAHRGKRGTGEVTATAYAIPAESVGYWLERLKQHRVNVERTSARFGEEVLRFTDDDGMVIELIATSQPGAVRTWDDGPVPAEHALRGFHSVSLSLDDPADTARLLTETFGYKPAGEAENRFRFTSTADIGQVIDLVQAPKPVPGGLGAGSVHHVAFRATDDTAQLDWRKELKLQRYGVSPVMDRTYFHSIYFREPGGVLFEIATDGPGFATDESVEELGTQLQLPSWMESSRSRIEEILPKINLPTAETV